MNRIIQYDEDYEASTQVTITFAPTAYKPTRESQKNSCTPLKRLFVKVGFSCTIPEVVEGGGVLARGEVHHSEIIGDDPLEWSEVHGALQAGHGRHVLSLPEEAHACHTRNMHSKK